MKKILLLLVGCICLQACHSTRMHSLDRSMAKDSTQHYLPFTDPLLEASLTADTYPGVNAAQISDAQPLMEDPIPQEIKITKQASAAKRVGVLKTIKLAKKWYKSLDDSTKLYTRRNASGIRQVNPSARASLWTGIGTYALLILGAGTAVFSLLAIFSAVAAVVTGIVGLSEIHHFPELYRGKGQAIAGICLGGTFIAILALVLLIVLALLGSY